MSTLISPLIYLAQDFWPLTTVRKGFWRGCLVLIFCVLMNGTVLSQAYVTYYNCVGHGDDNPCFASAFNGRAQLDWYFGWDFFWGYSFYGYNEGACPNFAPVNNFIEGGYSRVPTVPPLASDIGYAGITSISGGGIIATSGITGSSHFLPNGSVTPLSVSYFYQNCAALPSLANFCPNPVLVNTSTYMCEAGFFGAPDNPAYCCGGEPQICPDGLFWDFANTVCAESPPYSPIIIDIEGDGFSLTSSPNGVYFDLDSIGNVENISWTAGGSDDAFLALDNNSNDLIENGTELFGNFTAQPEPPAGAERNGFLALAQFDKVVAGGNGDGKITAADAIFASLRLWQDTNHNAISEPNELLTLDAVGLTKMHLDYQSSRRTDEFGNKFKYRAKVKDANGAQLGRWAWDVFLTRSPMP